MFSFACQTSTKHGSDDRGAFYFRLSLIGVTICIKAVPRNDVHIQLMKDRPGSHLSFAPTGIAPFWKRFGYWVVFAPFQTWAEFRSAK